MNTHQNSPTTTNQESQTKRRKIRRGTRSCWECKRRKVRCIFSSSEDEVCVACRRRGAKCINQELPEEHSRAENSGSISTGQLQRAGNLLQISTNDIEQGTSVDDDTATPGRDCSRRIEFLTPASTSNETTSQIGVTSPIARINASTSQDVPNASHLLVDAGNYGALSRVLHTALPSQQDLNILCSAEYKPAIYFYQVSLKSYQNLEQEGFDRAAALSMKPSSSTHPVLLAQRMLILAIFLHNLIPQANHGLSEHPRVMMERLANTAIRLVATNDELSGTMEYLECQMLEASYHWYCGSLRRAYLSWRRALVLAQVMGIHRQYPPPIKRIRPGAMNSPQFVWFRIVYMDRFFSLMLRLPQGTSDARIEREAALLDATPNERLERAHAVAAGHILERNEHDPHLQDYSATQNIDSALLRAANCLPSRFWSHPNLAGVQMNSKGAFQEVIRQVDQIFHYTLVNLLHLPYLLRFNTERKYEYSRMTCVNASREVLIRLGTFNNYDAETTYCRPAHFFALLGAVTLLLAHINNRQSQEAANMLAHQRLGDHAMIEQVVEKMELVGRLSEDILLKKSAVLLRRLLDAEEDSAQGRRYSLLSIEANEDDLENQRSLGDELQITLPYFGSIRLVRQTPDAVENMGNGGCSDAPQTRNTNTHDTVPSHAHPNCTEPQSAIDSSPLHPSIPLGLTPTDGQQKQSLCSGPGMDVSSGVFGDIDTSFFENLMNNVNVADVGSINDTTCTWDWGCGELFSNE